MGLFDFLKFKPKHIFNENGENIIFFDRKKDGIKCKFYKKNGALHGPFTTYYLQSMIPTLTISLKGNFVGGLLDGDATEYSSIAGINRIHEVYDYGSLISKKVYYCGLSKRGELASQAEFKKDEEKKGLIAEDFAAILKQYKISNFIQKQSSKIKYSDIEKSINQKSEHEVEKYLLDKISEFNDQSYADLYDIDINNFEIKYWYDIILKRVKSSNLIQDHGKKDLDHNLGSLIWGHADEYGKKYINENLDFKRIIALSRIICFGHIYSVLLEIETEIKNSNISNSYCKEIKDRLFHAKASVYGAIKFALFSGISKDEIKNWFPNFEDNEELIMGVNALEEEINNIILKSDNSDNKNLQKFEGIYDGEKRVQIYELNELERINIPDWFKGPFYTKGGVSTSKLTKKKYNLNALEKSIFAEIQYNTALIQIVSQFDNINRESFNNPYFEYLIQVIDEGTEWFKKNNTDAYNKLFVVSETCLKLNSNDDKLVALIGLMISLVQQDDVFCNQEKIYIEKFISQLSETKRHEITEKLSKKELSGLISIVETLDADDQNDILNKLIEIAAVDNKIDGKEAYLICFLANSINVEVQQVVDFMVESYDFDPKLLDEEISRMNNENKKALQADNKNFEQNNQNKDTSTIIGYRRHSKL